MVRVWSIAEVSLALSYFAFKPALNIHSMTTRVQHTFKLPLIVTAAPPMACLHVAGNNVLTLKLPQPRGPARIMMMRHDDPPLELITPHRHARQ